MIRKGKGEKTFARERKLFSNTKKGRTPAETLHFKIISMRTRDLKNIVQNPDKVDLLTLSFAKEELDRRNFNQKNKIDTQSKRHKLNKKFPEHKHIMKKWKEHKKRNRVE
jgi:hypothetical protein